MEDEGRSKRLINFWIVFMLTSYIPHNWEQAVDD